MSHRSLLRVFCIICLLAICAFAVTPAQAFTLTDAGKPCAVYIKTDSPKDVQDAAAELARVLELMTGTKPAVTQIGSASEIPADKPGLVLGELADSLGVKMNKTSRAGDGYRFKTVGNKVAIVGESTPGVYTGAVRFLETLGCGWFVPGPMGEVIPKQNKIDVPDTLDVTGVSDSINRRFWYGGKNSKGQEPTAEWVRRNNGNNYQSGSWSHAYAHLIPKAVLKENPEYGSFFRGQRGTRQLCTTNPKVVEIGAQTILKDMEKSSALVFNAGPNDGGGLCECEACTAIDTQGYLEPSSGRTNASDRIFLFASAIADITSKTYPNKDLGILVYSDYSRIPQKISKLNPNVFPMIAPIRRCRLHGPGNPNCDMNKLWQEEIRGWAKVSPTKLGFYMYNYNLADAMFPLSKVTFYKQLTAETTQLKIPELAWIFESIDAWSSHAPSLYLSARISWDSHIDIDKEMDRFYKGFYGAAHEPMTRYWTRIDDAITQGNTHTGSSYGMHKIWTAKMLADSRADIELAKKKATNEREQQAVAMAEAGLDCATLYMEVWNAMANAEFAKAGEAQAKFRELSKTMDSTAGKIPSWGHDRYTFGYYNMFVGKTVTAAENIVKAGGQVVVKLPDVWQFTTDEKLAGVNEGWFKPDFNDSGWKKMGTMSTSWVDAGMTWYHGDTWYRTTFELPVSAKDQDLRLWFGGFDSLVDVYLNGQHLGELKGFAKPGEFADIAKHLNFGGKNTLAVRAPSGGLDEIGTGGIMMPVVIYKAAPAAPTTKPANEKDKGVGYEM